MKEEENEIAGDCSLMIVIVTVITWSCADHGIMRDGNNPENLMRVTALVGLTALGVGNPGFAASAETTARVLEVSEYMFHKSSLGWEVSSASVEIAWEL